MAEINSLRQKEIQEALDAALELLRSANVTVQATSIYGSSGPAVLVLPQCHLEAGETGFARLKVEKPV